MEKAIKKAKEGGYKAGSFADDGGRYELLDPLFWQALGKAMGWKDMFMGEPIDKKMQKWLDEREKETGEPYNKSCKREGWLHYWLTFILHLAEGKDAESFFNELLK